MAPHQDATIRFGDGGGSIDGAGDGDKLCGETALHVLDDASGRAGAHDGSDNGDGGPFGDTKRSEFPRELFECRGSARNSSAKITVQMKALTGFFSSLSLSP